MTPVAMFTHDPDTGRYWPANKNAVAACARLSKRCLPESDLVVVRSWGYRPTLTNGQDIGRVDVLA